MKIILTTLYIFLALSIFSQTSTVETIQHDGVTREYRLYVPASYDGTVQVPLLFNLHGYTSNASQQEVYGDFRPIADTANFILVHPEGLPDGGGNQMWNAFGTGGADDIGFISRMIDTLSFYYEIDANRIYSTGMSNGGYMSFELACALGNRITAVASVTGGMTTNRMTACNPVKPTPIMQIHGTQDGTVPYNGSAITEPIPDVVNFWVDHANCSTTPVITNVPNTNTADNCTAEHYFYSGGDRGTTVEHYKIINGGHTWPGAPITIGTTNQDIDASYEIWRFFSQYSMDQLVSLTENDLENALNIYPNPTSGKVNFELSKSVDKIKISDALGRVVMEINNPELFTEVMLNQKGVYFAQFSKGKEMVTRKIIVR